MDGFDQAKMEPRTMRLADVHKQLLRQLRTGQAEGFDWRLVEKGRIEGEMRIGALTLTIRLDITLNKHPTGTETGLKIGVRLTERLLTLAEAGVLAMMMELVGPQLEELERDFADIRVWE